MAPRSPGKALPLRCTRPSPRLNYKLSVRPPLMCQTQWLRLILAYSTCWCAPGFCAWPLLFLAYTIDLPNCVAVPTSCDQFADDTALTTVSPSPTECEGHLQRSVDATSAWLSDWKLAVNVDKTVSMEFTRRPFSSDFAINLNGNTLQKVRIQRHLGLVLTSDLRWTAHVNQVLSKEARLLHTLKRLRCTLSKAALTLYYCLIWFIGFAERPEPYTKLYRIVCFTWDDKRLHGCEGVHWAGAGWWEKVLLCLLFKFR